jgi:hypothetical protein
VEVAHPTDQITEIALEMVIMTAIANSPLELQLSGKPLVNTAEIAVWRRAKKTKGIKAKAMNALLADESMLSKFLLDTIEGTQTLKAGSIVCMGSAGDAWQQKERKLFSQYNVTGMTPDGWMLCEPKPDVERDAYEVAADQCGPDGDFSIIGQWGTEQILDNKKVYLQFGKVGDIICRNPEDHTDVWIVRRKEFDATQEFVN